MTDFDIFIIMLKHAIPTIIKGVAFCIPFLCCLFSPVALMMLCSKIPKLDKKTIFEYSILIVLTASSTYIYCISILDSLYKNAFGSDICETATDNLPALSCYLYSITDQVISWYVIVVIITVSSTYIFSRKFGKNT